MRAVAPFFSVLQKCVFVHLGKIENFIKKSLLRNNDDSLGLEAVELRSN